MRTIPRTVTVALTLGAFGLLFASPARPDEIAPIDQVLESIVARENEMVRTLRQYRPLVETYVQILEPDKQLGTAPVADDYFLGRLDLSAGSAARSPAGRPGPQQKLLDLFQDFYRWNLQPDGFARMIVPDADSFDRQHYDFEFVRREFLGDVRTLVFDVVPKGNGPTGRFIGRIWAEDEGYGIVRYNGTRASASNRTLHFDSWRLNLQPGLWLPAYVYTEESESQSRAGSKPDLFRGQTRIWGYERRRAAGDAELARILVETPLASDRTDNPGDLSPVKSLRAWEREAEENVLARLEKGGLLAPEGEVDEVLRTVVDNLEITNSLDIQPPVRCRVLLTTPLESFTVGHTIVLSRGMIDVLPDEASLATVLAHELGHILLGHSLDTRYAFGDRMLVDDKETMEKFFFLRDPEEEAAADEKALMLLDNSPYKDKLAGAGLFLKALAARSKSLPALIRPHFGNRLTKNNKLIRLTRLLESAPEFYPAALNQTAALPLGGRVKVDPWTGRIELMKNNQVVLLSPQEKKPFEITPLMPHLVRLRQRQDGATDTPATGVASAGGSAAEAPAAGVASAAGAAAEAAAATPAPAAPQVLAPPTQQAEGHSL